MKDTKKILICPSVCFMLNNRKYSRFKNAAKVTSEQLLLDEGAVVVRVVVSLNYCEIQFSVY